MEVHRQATHVALPAAAAARCVSKFREKRGQKTPQQLRTYLQNYVNMELFHAHALQDRCVGRFLEHPEIFAARLYVGYTY